MNEFIAGAVSGFGQTLVGHPFDTVKVRLQNNVSLTKLKPQHYYRGVGYPLFSSSTELFSTCLLSILNSCK